MAEVVPAVHAFYFGGLRHAGPDQRRQFAGQSFNPFNALGPRAQLLVKDESSSFGGQSSGLVFKSVS
jgi:hypothetical protein